MNKAFLNKIFTIKLLFLALSALFLLSSAYAKSYYYPSTDQTVELRQDGSVKITEIITMKFDGSFSYAYLAKKLKGQYGNYEVEYLSVKDADSKTPMKFNSYKENGEQVLKWYYSATNTTRRFEVVYVVKGAVQKYGDAAQFYWQMLELDHELVENLRIRIIPNKPSQKLFKVFVHSGSLIGDLTFAKDFSSSEITLNNINRGTFVEVRVLLDPALFPEAATLTGQSHESLLKDEARFSEKERTAAEDYKPVPAPTAKEIMLLAAAPVTIYIIFIILGIVLYLKNGREPQTGYEGIYEREPPMDIPPAVVPAIMPQTAYDKTKMGQAFAATIIEAARLGYLDISETEDKGILGTGLFKQDDLLYRLLPKGQALLRNQPVEYQPNERRLETFEIEVLTTIFNLSPDRVHVTGDQIEAWGKSMSGKKSHFLRYIERWGPSLRSWFESTHFKLDDPQAEKAKNTYLITLLIGTIIACVIAFYAMAALIIISLILMAIFNNAISRRTTEAALNYQKWEAFKRFISDYSAMNEAGPNLLHIWDHYLVYAVALGVADKLLANLQMVIRENNYTFYSPVWFHSRADMTGIGNMNFNSLTSLSKSMDNFNNLSRALSSSSSSGGGFSGGGGGGGGGGGRGAG